MKLLEQFQASQKLAAVGKRKWEEFLHADELARPQTHGKRMALFAPGIDDDADMTDLALFEAKIG